MFKIRITLLFKKQKCLVYFLHFLTTLNSRLVTSAKIKSKLLNLNNRTSSNSAKKSYSKGDNTSLYQNHGFSKALNIMSSLILR